MRPTVLTFCFIFAVKLTNGYDLGIISSLSPRFSQHLYETLALNQSNIVYSPYSIQSVFGIALLGAVGQTAEEISRVVFQQEHLDKSVHEQLLSLLIDWNNVKEVELDISNALFVHPSYPIEAQFVYDVRHYYHGESSNFDMAVPGGPEKQINDFVAEKTKGFIENLIPAGTITPYTKVIAVNAIFFNGTWESPFDKKATRQADFYTRDRGVIKVETMHDAQWVYLSRDVLGVADVLELSFCGDRFAFTIALPKYVDGITQLENALREFGDFTVLFGHLKLQYVKLALPKFRINSDFELKDTLFGMGVKLAFSDYANFEGINKRGGLHITEVFHKAVIDVQETGTVASAASGLTIEGLSLIYGYEEIKVDHPFLFFLRDRLTGVILFQGKFSG